MVAAGPVVEGNPLGEPSERQTRPLTDVGGPSQKECLRHNERFPAKAPGLCPACGRPFACWRCGLVINPSEEQPFWEEAVEAWAHWRCQHEAHVLPNGQILRLRDMLGEVEVAITEVANDLASKNWLEQEPTGLLRKIVERITSRLDQVGR